MKKLLLIALGSLLAAPLCVAQKESDISIPEFRQALIDSLSLLDARKAEAYAKVLPAVPDAMLANWYKGVPDGRRFQAAVAHLKSRKDEARSRPLHQAPVPAGLSAASPAQRATRFQIDAAQPSPAIGIASTVVPPIGLFTPAYPSGSNWFNMVSTLETSGYLPNGDLSSANCSPDDQSGLTIAVSTFQGIKDAADGICEVIPDPLVVVLGEGTAIPLKEICYGVALVLAVVNSALEGYLQDCETQNLLTSGAENQAAYNNTIALYNLKFRLKVEQNLQNTGFPIGIFELPASQGGYLEFARSIVADTIAKVASTGVNTSSATASMVKGDTYFNATPPSYKLAYKQYQLAYNTAVQ